MRYKYNIVYFSYCYSTAVRAAQHRVIQPKKAFSPLIAGHIEPQLVAIWTIQ